MPTVKDFRSLDAVVEQTVGANADGQAVMDWDLHRQIEGRGYAGIPQWALTGAVARLIGACGVPNVPDRVVGRFARSVASMGRYGEITPLMLNGAVERVVAGQSCVDVCTGLYRQVMEHRWRCRDMERLLLLNTDGGSHPYTAANSRQFDVLADVLPSREVPAGERVVDAADAPAAARVTA